jgi:GntR family transcriptional regulator/MocR family aminotransferase
VRKTWAISGVDLHLDLNGSHVRSSLEAALRDAIASGRLQPGTRLPSSRGLAADLGIGRNTVAEAYGQLAAEGWLNALQGSGTRVARRTVEPLPRATSREQPATHLRYDLRAGTPDLAGFPRAAWLAANRRAVRSASYRSLDYADPRGLAELRTALANYLARARGVHVTPARLLVCSGFTQAFGLLCDVLRARGASTIALEQYLQPGILEIAAARGLRITTLPVDEHGAAVDQLGTVGAVLLTAAHQFPLGAPLAARRRAEVVEWARGTGAVVIEDDYDGEFRYDRHPLGALQALAPEHVVYAGTASKTLAPGVRLAWLAMPEHIVDELVQAKFLADRNSSAFDQLTLGELVQSGGYDRHVRRARLAYRRRRDRLTSTLRREAPHVRLTGIAAGLHALLELPAGADEQAIVRGAAVRGLALEGLGAYAASKTAATHEPALVVGYARPPEHAFTGAIARLVATLAEGAAPLTGPDRMRRAHS